MSLKERGQRLQKFSVTSIEPISERGHGIIGNVIQKIRTHRCEASVCGELVQRTSIKELEQFSLMVSLKEDKLPSFAFTVCAC